MNDRLKPTSNELFSHDAVRRDEPARLIRWKPGFSFHPSSTSKAVRNPAPGQAFRGAALAGQENVLQARIRDLYSNLDKPVPASDSRNRSSSEKQMILTTQRVRTTSLCKGVVRLPARTTATTMAAQS